jgi:hypothetical protein
MHKETPHEDPDQDQGRRQPDPLSTQAALIGCMTRYRYRLVAVAGVLLGTSVPVPSRALTCPTSATFSDKVRWSPNIVIGELGRIEGKRYTVKVVKVLKDNGLLQGKKTFTLDHGVPRMGSGFEFATKTGQLILFFFEAKHLDWTCSGPILIR